MILADQTLGIDAGRACRLVAAGLMHFPAQTGSEPEGAACAWRTLQASRAAHQLCQPAGNGQAETGATVSACRRVVGLHKGVEQLGTGFGRNADAGILDFEAHQKRIGGIFLNERAQGDRALLGELDGVGGVVEHSLLQPCRVAMQVCREGLGFDVQA